MGRGDRREAPKLFPWKIKRSTGVNNSGSGRWSAAKASIKLSRGPRPDKKDEKIRFSTMVDGRSWVVTCFSARAIGNTFAGFIASQSRQTYFLLPVALKWPDRNPAGTVPMERDLYRRCRVRSKTVEPPLVEGKGHFTTNYRRIGFSIPVESKLCAPLQRLCFLCLSV